MIDFSVNQNTQIDLSELDLQVDSQIKIFNKDNIGLKLIDLINGFELVLDNKPVKYSQAGSKHKL